MATTLFDSVTGATVTQTGWKATDPSGRSSVQINIATGNPVTTVGPNQPKGFNPDISQAFRPGAGQQAQTVGNLATGIAGAVGIKPIIDRAGVVPDSSLIAQGTLAQRTASTFAGELYTKYENLFFANQNNKLSESLTVLKNNYSSDLASFRAKYAERDESLIPQAVDVSVKSLITRAQQGTPLAPQPLFGFIPLKVSGLVQGLSNLVAIAATAGASAWLSTAGEVGAATSPAVGTSLTAGGAVETVGIGSNLGGGFVADFGIRGAQAVNLAAAGATPGAVVGLGSLQASTFSIGAAGGLVTMAPATIAPSVQALRLGVVAPSTPTFLDGVLNSVKATAQTTKAAVLENPVKSALSAAGTALTAKQIAGSSNPLAALVNTVSSAVGLGPIIPNPKPGPNTAPPNFFQPNQESGSGGGGGGGGSYGGSSVFESGSLFPIMGILAAVGLLAVVAIRR